MKRIYLILLSLIVLSLFSLESDPSEIVGVVKYECVTNANGNYTPIAISLDAGYALASEIDADYPEITSIGTWNETDQKWDIASDLGGGFWFPDPAISPNQPLLVTVSADKDLYITGSLNSTPSYTLAVNSNGNYTPIMLPFDSSISLASEMDVEVPELTSAGEWNSVDQKWDIGSDLGGGFWFPDTPMIPGQVYLVTVSSQVTWPSS